MGPLLFGFTTRLAGGNQRPGFLVLTVLFIIGLALLQRVKDPRAVVV
jgi:MFS-type transporter involved in bile tolerance (Atg22 family)